ncbi:hypothetical protein [Nocardioides sp. MH1]|uniref:hypothetical protein n=1 Tax=Nocardioides sp. MH1 TaxID=3242490 RepID=UPI003522DDE9
MGENDRKLAISDDELKALTTVLGTLSLLPKSEEQAAGTKSAIEDFTLNITTSTQKLIKTITGTGAAAGSVATITAWLKDQNDLVLASSLLSTALVLAVGLFSLAKVMDGDVRGRASAATAAVEARGLVARALIDIYGSAATQGAGRARGPARASRRLTKRLVRPTCRRCSP